MSKHTHSLAALQSYPALQRRSQTAVEEAKALWFAAIASELAVDLRRYADGQALTDCAVLQKAVTDHAAALALVEPLVRTQCKALGNFPFAHIPFRHQYQDGIAVLRLMEAGSAALSLVMYEQTPLSPARTVCFSDNECCEIVLAGKGEGRRLRVTSERTDGADIQSERLILSTGASYSFNGPDMTKLLDLVEGRLVMLRLTRTPGRPSDSREYRIDDGACIHRASGDRQKSRQEMALALLGAMKRSDAAGEMQVLALERSQPNRWEALRQLLALDTAQGFTCLTRVAADPADPLSPEADKLKTRLLRSYPALSRLKAEPCPV